MQTCANIVIIEPDTNVKMCVKLKIGVQYTRNVKSIAPHYEPRPTVVSNSVRKKTQTHRDIHLGLLHFSL